MVKRVSNLLALLAMSIYSTAYYLDIRKIPRREKIVVEYILIALAILLAVETIRAIVDFIKSRRGNEVSLTEHLPRSLQSMLQIVKNKQVVVVFLTGIYIIIFPTLGFFLTSFIYVFLLNLLLGTKSKVQLFAIPTGLLIFVYVLFVVLFGVKLPTGILI